MVKTIVWLEVADGRESDRMSLLTLAWSPGETAVIGEKVMVKRSVRRASAPAAWRTRA